MKKQLIIAMLVIFWAVSLTGCTFIFQKGRRSDVRKIEELSRKLNELDQTKQLLEDRLAQEIKDKQVKLQMMEKGLVITFVADVLFDSGKASIRSSAMPILDKVAVVLNENVPDLKVGIEGHTDDQPIRVSGWKSNWELSSSRALSVLHYLVGEKSVAPERLSALAYGQYRPVASNDAKDGQQLNRRVEIVILPDLSKGKGKKASFTPEPQDNLK